LRPWASAALTFHQLQDSDRAVPNAFCFFFVHDADAAHDVALHGNRKKPVVKLAV
jgi:hypothetical protein